MTKLIVVRHAQSEGNLAHFYTGQTNINLTDIGHAQAELTAELLDDYQFDVVLSSPLVRAQQTARHTTDRRHMELIIDPGLIEINGGIWEGQPYSFCKEKYPYEWDLWENNFINAINPGGEGIRDLIHRVSKTYQRIVETYKGKTVLIFTHGTPIRVMSVYWKGLPWRAVNNQPWANNASVTVVRYDDDGSITLEQEAYYDHLEKADLIRGII